MSKLERQKDEMIARQEQALHLECDKEISALRARLISWRHAFKHVHENNSINDACKSCGLDLRDDIHLRIGERFDLVPFAGAKVEGKNL